MREGPARRDTTPPARLFRLSGYVSDMRTGERLPYAQVWEARSRRGVVANAYGFFSLTLPSDTVTLLARFPDYLGQSETFYLDRSRQIDLRLDPYLSMQAVPIEAAAKDGGAAPESADMSTLVLPMSEVKHLPALLGEVDAIRSIQLLPGVQSGAEGTTGLYVRGGSPDQNLVLLDGAPLYYVNHWGGFASVFNADALQDLRLIKGGFPARYGGRLSSVLEMTMKEGNRRETEVAGSIGLLSAKISVQGPIGKKPGQAEARTSYILSARRNYFDLIDRGISLATGSESSGDESPLGYGFYDLNAKVNHTFSHKDRIYFSAYWGQDYSRLRQERTIYLLPDGSFSREPGSGGNPPDSSDTFYEKQESRIRWGNALAALRWNHVWGHRAFSNLSLSYTHYYYENDLRYREDRTPYVGSVASSQGRLRFASGISDAILRWEASFYPGHGHQLVWGAQAALHSYRPGLLQEQIVLQADTLRDTLMGDETLRGIDAFAFIEHDWRLSDRWQVHSGLHVAGYRLRGRSYGSLQPRLALRLRLREGMALKASYARMTQFTHLLINSRWGFRWTSGCRRQTGCRRSTATRWRRDGRGN